MYKVYGSNKSEILQFKMNHNNRVTFFFQIFLNIIHNIIKRNNIILNLFES